MANIKKGNVQIYVRDLITEVLSPNNDDKKPFSEERKAAVGEKGCNKSDPKENAS